MTEHDSIHRGLQEIISLGADRVLVEIIDIGTDQVASEVKAQGTGENFDIFDNIMHAFGATKHTNVHGATDIGIPAVLAAIVLNIASFIALILCYELFSRIMPSVYRSRSSFANRHHDEADAGAETKDNRAFVSLPPTYIPLGWIPAVLRVSWSQVRKTVGLDAYMFLRYIRMCLQITAISSFYSAIILMPVYASGGNSADGWYHLSMANVVQGSSRLWVPTVFMWLMTLYIMFVMNEEYKHYVECRMEFLAKGDVDIHPQQKYSLIVEEVPHELRSDRAMHDYFNELFPGKIHTARMVLNVPDLEEAYAKRHRVLRRLEKAIAINEATGRKPVHIVGRPRLRCCGIERLTFLPAGRKEVDLSDEDGRLPQRGEKVDSTNYYTRYLAIMNEKVKIIQAKKTELAQRGDNSVRTSHWIAQKVGLATDAAANTFDVAATTLSRSNNTASEDGLIMGFAKPRRVTFWSCLRNLGFDFLAGGFASMNQKIDFVADSVNGVTMSSTAFVSFSDLQTVTCAVRAPLSHEAQLLNVQMAPEPRDIRWENAVVNQSWSSGREWSANVLLFLGALLWSIPVASLQAFSNIKSLATIPGLHWLGNISEGGFTVFINAYLPVVALLCLVLVLPVVFEQIAEKYELRKTKSDIQRSILSRFFYYQLANIFVTVTAGSALDSLAEILDHPSSAFAVLGKSLPTVVGYFIIFLVTKILVGLPITLLRPIPLLRMAFLKCFCREKIMTQKEIDEVHKKTTMKYGWEYPNLLLVITICFTYSVISPVILPFGAVYFMGALIVYKKQAMVVYSPTYESGGLNFPSACHRTLIGLVCSQITLIGYVLLRLGFYQPVALFPLPFYTCGMIRFFKAQYEDPANYLSLKRAIDLDREVTTSDRFAEFDEDIYRQPVLTEKEVQPRQYRRHGLFGDASALTTTDSKDTL